MIFKEYLGSMLLQIDFCLNGLLILISEGVLFRLFKRLRIGLDQRLEGFLKFTYFGKL